MRQSVGYAFAQHDGGAAVHAFRGTSLGAWILRCSAFSCLYVATLPGDHALIWRLIAKAARNAEWPMARHGPAGHASAH